MNDEKINARQVEGGAAVSYHTLNQNVIVCPHCGHCHDDSGEWGHGFQDEQGADNCGKCGKEIFWSRETSVTYSTTKPTE